MHAIMKNIIIKIGIMSTTISMILALDIKVDVWNQVSTIDNESKSQVVIYQKLPRNVIVLDDDRNEEYDTYNVIFWEDLRWETNTPSEKISILPKPSTKLPMPPEEDEVPLPTDETEDTKRLFVQTFPESCEPQYDWQARSLLPTCNAFHEESFLPSLLQPTSGGDSKLSYIASGGFRDVWKVYDNYRADTNGTNMPTTRDNNSPIVLKTLVWWHNYTQLHYDRHRIDAVINERLTGSPFIVPIYGACANSAFNEFASGGTLKKLYENGLLQAKPREGQDPAPLGSIERLILAYQVVSTVYDFHYKAAGREVLMDNSTVVYPSLAHTDLKPEQFIYFPKEGIVKLTDFNRCQMLFWDKKQSKTCDYRLFGGNGKFRSPEEYKDLPQSDKTDVYTMGNILYTIFTGFLPYRGIDISDAVQLAVKGIKSEMDIAYLMDTHDREYVPDKVLVKAISYSMRYNKEDRKSSKEIKEFLYGKLKSMGILSEDQGFDYIPRLYI